MRVVIGAGGAGMFAALFATMPARASCWSSASGIRGRHHGNFRRYLLIPATRHANDPDSIDEAAGFLESAPLLRSHARRASRALLEAVRARWITLRGESEVRYRPHAKHPTT